MMRAEFADPHDTRLFQTITLGVLFGNIVFYLYKIRIWFRNRGTE